MVCKSPRPAIMPLFLKLWTALGDRPRGLSVKSTRKTWESWLVASYPDRFLLVSMSQGHTEFTALKH